ncbi:MAG: hypothetical protein LBL71_02920 [Endomicrobium sp.]|nr:hypothetical protein [Endomicrobium sp.]
MFPDSKLKNENEPEFLSREAYEYALEKIYISWTPNRNMKKSDLILFYRMGDKNTKKYSSVITTLGIITDISFDFKSKNEFLDKCKNRSVFSGIELNKFSEKLKNIVVVKFIYAKSLNKRPTLAFLWDEKIVKCGEGPRPFTKIKNCQFDSILTKSETDIEFIKE